jgi:hypothetical protein
LFFNGSKIADPQPAQLVAGGQQLIQRASGLDAAILQHNDLVGPAQRGAAVRHGQNG